MKAISLREVQAEAAYKPEGYLQDVLSRASGLSGDKILIDDHALQALREQYLSARPSLLQEIRGLCSEISRWKRAGWKIAHWRVFLARTKACASCPYSFKRFGLSRCGRCGCTRAKALLASGRCPVRRWPV